MALQKSRAGKFGVGILSVTVGGTAIISTTAATLQSRTHRRSANKVELTGEDGEPQGLCFYNQVDEVTLTCVPSSATDIATAIANQNAITGSTIGAAAVLADTDGTVLDGNFILEEISNPQNVGQYATVDVTLRKYSTDLSTTRS